MTILNGIHEVAEWLRSDVCPNIELKVPDNKHQGDSYKYKLMNPNVHEMYAPPSKLAAATTKDICPCILIHLLDGEDLPRKAKSDLKFRLILSVWNPGRHPGDVLGQNEEGAKFVPTADGWKDVWNLMDLLLSKLRNVEHIGETLRVKAEDGFQYGPYKEDDAVIDFYPFYFAELDFACEMSEAPPTKYYADDYL